MAIKISHRIVTGIARIDKTLYVLLPNLYMQTHWNNPYSEWHYFTIEFRVMYFGIGVKFTWKNKDKRPLPENIY